MPNLRDIGFAYASATYRSLLFQTGLRLTLNVNQAQYKILSTCDVAGVRMVVLDHNKMPFPEDIGLSVNPGMYTAIGITTVSKLSMMF